MSTNLASLAAMERYLSAWRKELAAGPRLARNRTRRQGWTKRRKRP